VITSTVEKEFDQTYGFRQLENISSNELYVHSRSFRALVCSLDRERSNVDSHDFKTLLGQPNTVRSRSTADIQRSTGLNLRLTEHSLQFGGWSPRVPGKITFSVTLVPIPMLFHGSPSLSRKASMTVSFRPAFYNSIVIGLTKANRFDFKSTGGSNERNNMHRLIHLRPSVRIML
jgi:hypothetical protein